MLSRSRLMLQLNGRSFMTSALKRSEKKIQDLKIADSLKVESVDDFGKFPGMPKHIPSRMDKTFLVWSGHYKTIADVPNRVEYEQMSKAKNWARVRINIWMVGIAFLISGFMAYLGKQAAKQQLTVEDMNLNWHKQINAEHRKSQEAKAQQE